MPDTTSWGILNEYSKSVITIASALLALGAVASDRFVSGTPLSTRVLFGVAAGLVLLSLVAALLVAAKVYKCVAGQEAGQVISKDRKVLRHASNASYMTLGLALLLIVLSATLRSGGFHLVDASDAAIEAIARVRNLPKNRLTVTSAVWDPASERYVISALDSVTVSTIAVTVDPRSHEVVSIR